MATKEHLPPPPPQWTGMPQTCSEPSRTSADSGSMTRKSQTPTNALNCVPLRSNTYKRPGLPSIGMTMMNIRTNIQFLTGPSSASRCPTLRGTAKKGPSISSKVT